MKNQTLTHSCLKNLKNQAVAWTKYNDIEMSQVESKSRKIESQLRKDES